ncbi:MAG: YciK family oxidoreductase [Gammaproteobacteria bacterium]|nr:YciK family oxidoreductase [Gammaproteobacteria bacterium]MBT8111500.1 YciK family oxidoreductase [Gammaproteobacteria bacterium]NND47735.1 YciK family oxidoreductase [Woeseiaceae bacterium]NNL46198.1 YciK family oxidoreductase [Woeseiaceae bacterium]
MSSDPRSYTYPADLLRDRIVLITGASDGIGRALALLSASLGAQVILHGRSVSKLEKVYDEVEAVEGAPRPSIAVMDLASANSESYTTLAQSIEQEFGRLDGLVHNAGILGERYSIEQYDAVLWQRVMHVNVTSAFALTQVFLPLLHESDDASVIFTSSGVGRTGKAFWGAYAVSKFATEGLSQVLADEHRHGDLRSNCINPGPTRTKMRLEAYPAEDRNTLKGPEDVLATYIFLLGPDSKGVTGQSFDAQ